MNGGQAARGFCNAGPKLLLPVLGECYHYWLLRKSPRWGPQLILAVDSARFVPGGVLPRSVGCEGGPERG